MWIKIESGDIVNTDKFLAIRVYTYETRAGFCHEVRGNTGTDYTDYILSSYPTKEQAEQARDEIYGNLYSGARAMTMPVYNH
jgi:hypothetical protein